MGGRGRRTGGKELRVRDEPSRGKVTEHQGYGRGEPVSQTPRGGLVGVEVLEDPLKDRGRKVKRGLRTEEKVERELRRHQRDFRSVDDPKDLDRNANGVYVEHGNSPQNVPRGCP